MYYNSNSNALRFCQNGAWTGLGSSTPSYVSSLPGSPSNGQEIYYQADATNGVIWHLRYNSTSTKWEYLGGGSMTATVSGTLSTSSTSFVNISGPSITLPLNGDYIISAGTHATFGANAAQIYIGGVQQTPGLLATCGCGWNGNLSGTDRVNSMTSGNSVQLWFRSTDGSSRSFDTSWIQITPVRVY